MGDHMTTRAAGFLASQHQHSQATEEKYVALPSEDTSYSLNTSHADTNAEDEGLVSGQPRRREPNSIHALITSRLGLFTVAILCLLSGGLIATFFLSYLRNNNSKQGMILVKPCGSTAVEARARGCHFDIVSFMWLPDQCWDPELMADFEEANHLEWFLGPNRTGPLTRDQVISGEYNPVWVNWEYHWRHCTAMWKKMHRALLGPSGKAAIDGYVAPYHHTLHCEEMFLINRTKNFQDTDTEVRVKYPDCGMP